MEFLDPPTPPTAGDVWRATLRAFWDHGGSAASFCLGGRRGDPTPMLALLRKSFTLGPVDRTLGAVCGNDSVVQVHLCTAPEITQYYEVRDGAKESSPLPPFRSSFKLCIHAVTTFVVMLFILSAGYLHLLLLVHR